MHSFYLMIRPVGAAAADRVALDAANGDHALHLAEGHARDCDVELWDGDRLLARMEASTPNLWTLQSVPGGMASVAANGFERARTAGDGIAMGQG